MYVRKIIVIIVIVHNYNSLLIFYSEKLDHTQSMLDDYEIDRFIDLIRIDSKFETGALVLSNSVSPPIIDADAPFSVSFYPFRFLFTRPFRVLVSRAIVSVVTISTIMSFGCHGRVIWKTSDYPVILFGIVEFSGSLTCAPMYGNIWIMGK